LEGVKGGKAAESAAIDCEIKLPARLRRFFLVVSMAQGQAPGIINRRFETANLPNCSLIKATLISRNALSRAVPHSPIAMRPYSK
jgi:hypothetical protein